MSSGAQVDLDWAGADAAGGGAGASPADAGAAGVGAGLGAGARGADGSSRYLTDEEILGITTVGGDAGRDSSGRAGLGMTKVWRKGAGISIARMSESR